MTSGAGHFWPQRHYLNHFGRDTLDDAPCQISKLQLAKWFSFEKVDNADADSDAGCSLSIISSPRAFGSGDLKNTAYFIRIYIIADRKLFSYVQV